MNINIDQYMEKYRDHILFFCFFLPSPTSMFQLNVSEADNDGLQMSGDYQITSFQVQHKQLNMRYESARRPDSGWSAGPMRVMQHACLQTHRSMLLLNRSSRDTPEWCASNTRTNIGFIYMWCQYVDMGQVLWSLKAGSVKYKSFISSLISRGRPVFGMWLYFVWLLIKLDLKVHYFCLCLCTRVPPTAFWVIINSYYY